VSTHESLLNHQLPNAPFFFPFTLIYFVKFDLLLMIFIHRKIAGFHWHSGGRYVFDIQTNRNLTKNDKLNPAIHPHLKLMPACGPDRDPLKQPF